MDSNITGIVVRFWAYRLSLKRPNRDHKSGEIPWRTPTGAPLTNPIWNKVRRTISQYDLTSVHNPGAVISHPLVRGMNYDDWACGIKTTLWSRKKFGFLNGSIKQPEEGSSDLEDWWTIQALLMSWIKMKTESTMRSNISHKDVPHKITSTFLLLFFLHNVVVTSSSIYEDQNLSKNFVVMRMFSCTDRRYMQYYPLSHHQSYQLWSS